METDVVASAERHGVGQSRSRREFLQIGLAFDDLRGQQGLKLGGRGAPHQFNQARIFAEWDRIAPLLRERGREPKVIGQRRTKPGGQHAAADIRQKLATV